MEAIGGGTGAGSSPGVMQRVARFARQAGINANQLLNDLGLSCRRCRLCPRGRPRPPARPVRILDAPRLRHSASSESVRPRPSDARHSATSASANAARAADIGSSLSFD
jgi:hypothetical protein